MWSIRNTALEQPIPEDLPRLHSVFSAPSLYHKPAVDLLAYEYNSTPQHIRTCGAVAAHFLEITERDGLVLSGQREPLTDITNELLLATTERVVGVCGILSNTLTGVLSLKEFHQPGIALTINIVGNRLEASWPDHDDECFELNSLIAKIAHEREKFSEPEAQKLASLIIGELIEGDVPIPGFSTRSAEGSKLVLGHHVVSQPDYHQADHPEGLSNLISSLLDQNQSNYSVREASNGDLAKSPTNRLEPGLLARITSHIPILNYFFSSSE